MDVLVFAKPAQGCMCEVYSYPSELFLCAQIDQGDRTDLARGKTFAGVPNSYGYQGERRGNKAKKQICRSSLSAAADGFADGSGERRTSPVNDIERSLSRAVQ